MSHPANDNFFETMVENEQEYNATVEDTTRTELCMALAALYGTSVYNFDGLTFPEIWGRLSNKEQAEVQAYLTGMQAGLRAAKEMIK